VPALGAYILAGDHQQSINTIINTQHFSNAIEKEK
jgi:hypothetical protein